VLGRDGEVRSEEEEEVGESKTIRVEVVVQEREWKDAVMGEEGRNRV
jgi:hypothetical protein